MREPTNTQTSCYEHRCQAASQGRNKMTPELVSGEGHVAADTERKSNRKYGDSVI